MHRVEAEVPGWLEYLDHTADEGVRVRADSQAQLFERAAWGMMSLLVDVATVAPAGVEQVAVEADDREALLVRWLSEINRLHQVRHRVYCRFNVRSISDTAVEGEIGGEAVDRARHSVYGEIKAVTFHGLRVAEEDGVWTAQVLFDV